MTTWMQAFRVLHEQLCTLHPSDRSVAVTVTPEAMLGIAKEFNEINPKKMNESEMRELRELRCYGLRIFRSEEGH